MTIYVVTLKNRYNERYEEEYYANEENAKARVEKISNIYTKAEAKGNSGEHWTKVVYEKEARITTIETKD